MTPLAWRIGFLSFTARVPCCDFDRWGVAVVHISDLVEVCHDLSRCFSPLPCPLARMSLLRDILQRRSEASGFEPPKALTSKRGMKNYASSVLSSGSTIRSVRSIAESVASFYSLVSGGSRVPKRRRAEVSRLGVPKFYKKNPKAAVDMPGVKYMDSDHLGPYTCAHAMSFGKQVDQTKAYWGSIVVSRIIIARDNIFSHLLSAL
jgi:hypothetical protein